MTLNSEVLIPGYFWPPRFLLMSSAPFRLSARTHSQDPLKNSLRPTYSRGQPRSAAARFTLLTLLKRRLAYLGIGILAFVAASGQAFAFEWRKGPYLQALGPDAVTVKVELSEPLAAAVEIETRDLGTRIFESPEPKRFHAIRATDLKPGTTYRYRVRARGAENKASEEGLFTTAPLPSNSPAAPFRFIVYGDNRSDHSAHAAIVREIEAVPSDFLVHTGDMVHTGSNEAEWQTFFGIERTLLRDRCVFASVGNHELKGVDSKDTPLFLRYFAQSSVSGEERTSLYGSVRWSNTRFFFLNAMDTWTGEDRRWLEQELLKADDESGLVHRIAVLHHGPFSSGKHGGNLKISTTGALGLLDRHGVNLILSGHDHTYERGAGQGMKYIVSGGAGAPLYARKSVQPETLAFASVHHFVSVLVDGESITTAVHLAGGGILESCSFKGKEAWQCGEGNTQAGLVRGTALASAPSSSASCDCTLPGASAGRAQFSAFQAFYAAFGVSVLALLRRALGNKAKRSCFPRQLGDTLRP